MTLLEKITTRYRNFLFQETQKIEPKFYLVANNTEINNYEFLKDTGFYDVNSTCILFNSAYPLTITSDIQNHSNKWIFFRSLSSIRENIFYRDLSLLEKFHFERYYFIPDIFDYAKYKNRDYFLSTVTQLHDKNISLSRIHHMDIFESHEFRTVKKYCKNINKTISSGLWIYLYIKNKYPSSHITLVGYSANINTQFHDSSFEYGYLLSEILNNRCSHIKCLGLD